MMHMGRITGRLQGNTDPIPAGDLRVSAEALDASGRVVAAVAGKKPIIPGVADDEVIVPPEIGAPCMIGVGFGVAYCVLLRWEYEGIDCDEIEASEE